MKLKTSYFNKTIFLKNVLRFWPIWSLYLTILFFSMPVTLFLRTHISRTSSTNLSTDKLSSMINCMNGNLNPIPIFIFAIICAIAVFSYLYTARNCNMIHSLPVSRSELFITNYISGFLFLLVPQIIIFLLSLFICILNNVTSVEYLFIWLLYSAGMSFFFYSAAVFCCMLAGQHFAGFVYYILGNTLYFILKYLIATVITVLCFGMSGMNSNDLASAADGFLSPPIYLTYKTGIQLQYDDNFFNITSITPTGGTAIAFYCIPAAAFILLAFWAYKKRHLECAGDLLSVKWLKPALRWLIAFCAGTGLALIFTKLFFVDTKKAEPVLFLCTAAFSWVCFFLTEMLLQKKFRVFRKKRWLEWCVCAGAFMVILASFQADFFHLERRIPKTEDIRAAVINCNFDIVTTDAKELEVLKDIHQTIIENKSEYENFFYNHSQVEPGIIVSSSNPFEVSSQTATRDIDSVTRSFFSTVCIDYYLKNGRHISRLYKIPSSADYMQNAESAAVKLQNMQRDPDLYLKYLICANYGDVKFASGTIWLHNEDQEQAVEFSGDKAKALLDAFKQDLKEGNYTYGIGINEQDAGHTFYNSINLEGKIDGKATTIYDPLPQKRSSYNGNEVCYSEYYPVSSTSFNTVPAGNGKETTNIYTNISFTDKCTNLIQALIDLEIIQDKSELIYVDDYEALVEKD